MLMKGIFVFFIIRSVSEAIHDDSSPGNNASLKHCHRGLNRKDNLS